MVVHLLEAIFHRTMPKMKLFETHTNIKRNLHKTNE